MSKSKKFKVTKSYLKKEIVKINKSFNKLSRIQKYEIRKFLNLKFNHDIKKKSIQKKLISSFKKYNYKRKSIIDIANKHLYLKSDVENFFDTYLYEMSFGGANFDKQLMDSIMELVLCKTKVDEGIKAYVKNDFFNVLKNFLILVKRKGFTSDLYKIDYGLRIANEGDSAQFLFIARAILAGFNCSNVDVRSSKYDAIIDHNKKLIRVQVKGISSNGTISFMNRARGGKGIDYRDEKHATKKITSKDCDLLVAVDKQTGLCYLIPMTKVESVTKKTISRSSLNKYLESWDILEQL